MIGIFGVLCGTIRRRMTWVVAIPLACIDSFVKLFRAVGCDCGISR